MFESDVLKGHIQLTPDLVTNEKVIRSYLTKYSTGIKEYIKTHTIPNNLQIRINILLENLIYKEKEIFNIIKKLPRNVYREFTNNDDIKIT